MSGVFDSPIKLAFALLTMFQWDRFRSYTFDPQKDMQDLKGKVAIVTGGNTGIGYSTVKHLARRGAKVYMASRRKAKALAAILKLTEEGLGPGNGRVEFLHLDLSSARATRAAAEKLISQEQRLDILVNNAALLIEDPPNYTDGILNYMVVNHISPFILTTTLLPLMKKTSEDQDNDVRIVNVSSDACLYAPPTIRFRNLEDLNNKYADHPLPFYGRYCATKLANVLFAKELQRRFDAEGIAITAMSLHPGNVDSFAKATPHPRLAGFIMRFIFMSTDVGAYTSAFAAASPVVKSNSRFKGGYLQPVARLGEESDTCRNAPLAKELWETTESLIAERMGS